MIIDQRTNTDQSNSKRWSADKHRPIRLKEMISWPTQTNQTRRDDQLTNTDQSNSKRNQIVQCNWYVVVSWSTVLNYNVLVYTKNWNSELSASGLHVEHCSQHHRVCWVLLGGVQFTFVQRCSFWSIIVVITLGKWAFGSSTMFIGHMYSKVKILSENPHLKSWTSEALNMCELNTGTT
jgi:hypothetical protein